jgi:hypothetical protein
MKNQIDVYRSKTKKKQDSSGNHFSSIKISGVSPSDVLGVVDLHGTLGIVDLINDF